MKESLNKVFVVKPICLIINAAHLSQNKNWDNLQKSPYSAPHPDTQYLILDT